MTSDDDRSTSTGAAGILKNTLIVALDLESRDEAMGLVDELDDRIRHFKIGHRLYARYGPEILDACAERGIQVFLDLKLYDIPTEVRRTCARIAQHEAVYMTTVHASGGPEMLRAAVEGARSADRDGVPHVIAVTALTSFSGEELPEIGVGLPMNDWALQLGEMALKNGVDGLMTSTREVPQLRRNHGSKPLLVTPGIRLPKVEIAGDDQRRVDTPADALTMGATMIMMGRPVYLAPEPAGVVDAVAESLSDHGDGESS